MIRYRCLSSGGIIGTSTTATIMCMYLVKIERNMQCKNKYDFFKRLINSSLFLASSRYYLLQCLDMKSTSCAFSLKLIFYGEIFISLHVTRLIVIRRKMHDCSFTNIYANLFVNFFTLSRALFHLLAILNFRLIQLNASH